MKIDNLRPELVEILKDKGTNEFLEFQERILDSFKSGKNLLIEGHEGSGKTTAIQYYILNKITEASEGSPRVIVVCSNNEKAVQFHAELASIAKFLDLTVDLAHDRGNILQQRNDLFDGTEIIVGTPRRIYELYIQNGFNVSQLKMFILDDAIEILKGNGRTQIERIVESLPKCQHIITSHSFKDKRLTEYIDENLEFFSSIESD